MQEKKLHIKATDERMMPTYSNNIQITHSGEEFVLDMFSVYPPQGQLISRVVVSPQHAKRLAGALQENIRKYEDKYGVIPDKGVPFNIEGMNVGKNDAE